MPTSTAESRANKSADRRLWEADRRMQQAWQRDTRTQDPHEKHQWGVLIGCLLSESKNLDTESRRRMFEHLVGLAREMNAASRQV